MAVQVGIDPRSLDGLANQARTSRSQQTLQQVARQFEAVFADMMIHSMRSVHLGDDMLGRGGEVYTSLYDWQIAQSMTHGRGLGIASLLMRQMHAAAADTSSSNPAPSTPAGAAATEAQALSAHAAAQALRALDAADHFTGPDPAAVAAPTATQSDATSGTPAPSGAASLAPNVLGFVERLWPGASAIAQKLGVSVRAIIAQAALETGWGRHEAAPHNLFGVKATASQSGARDSTTEYVDGAPTQALAEFRRYPSDNSAMASYATLISTHPRYQAALGSGNDVQRFASALQQAGYASDPAYAEKLIAVANDPRLVAALSTIAGNHVE